jgi:hypothetical protein
MSPYSDIHIVVARDYAAASHYAERSSVSQPKAYTMPFEYVVKFGKRFLKTLYVERQQYFIGERNAQPMKLRDPLCDESSTLHLPVRNPLFQDKPPKNKPLFRKARAA